MKLSVLISVISAISQLLPSLSTIVKGVEAAFPTGSSGAQKLAAVEAALESAYSKLEGFEATWADVWPVLQTQITLLVNTFNALGIFTHAKAAAAAPAVATAPIATMTKA